jgi:hypothetical protein
MCRLAFAIAMRQALATQHNNNNSSTKAHDAPNQR